MRENCHRKIYRRAENMHRVTRANVTRMCKGFPTGQFRPGGLVAGAGSGGMAQRKKMRWWSTFTANKRIDSQASILYSFPSRNCFFFENFGETMFSQIISIFLNVVTPVFALVALGYTLGTKLQIQYRSLSRTAYYLLIPAFIFNVMSSIKVDLSLAGKMVFAITAIYVGTGALGWLAARLLGYGREMAVAFLMTCVFGNIGNYGLAMTGFRLGEESFGSATIYMVTVNAVAFSVCVLAAGWVRNGGVSALMTVFKTPGIMALPVALIFPVTGSEPPVMVGRITGLLGDAMIPLMLLTLGLQLRETGRLRFGFPVLAASGVRLIGGPLLAFFIIPLVGISGIEAAAGILQGSMPAAVITAIIAMEHDIVPEFVISTVFASTLLSLLTLTVVMALL